MFVGMKTFCFVSHLISSLSMPPLRMEDFRNRAMLSAVPESTLLASDGDKKRLKFDGVAIESQMSTPKYIGVTSLAWMWMGRRFTIQSLW